MDLKSSRRLVRELLNAMLVCDQPSQYGLCSTSYMFMSRMKISGEERSLAVRVKEGGERGPKSIE